MGRITINGITMDPVSQGPSLAAAGLTHADSSDSNYILIQVNAPMTAADKKQLAAAGAEIQESIPELTYLCYYEPDDLAPIKGLDFVDWCNVYHKRFKVAPDLRNAAAGDRAELMSLGEVETSMSYNMKWVDIVLHQNVHGDRVKGKLAGALNLDPSMIVTAKGKARLRVDSRDLETLAELDEVRHIEEYLVPTLHNNVALGIMDADTVHTTLKGDGQVVAICDTGFDKGSKTNVHPAFKNRVDQLYPLGRSRANDPNGHGTHVAGSVLGNGHSANMGGAIRGSAPGARLVLQSVLDSQGGLGGLPGNLSDLFRVPYDHHGARVHTNSWGAAARGRYTSNSREVDEFVWEHRDCVICFSAGNEGIDRNGDGVIDARSVGSPGTAKNCITVGASESMRPGGKPYGTPWPTNYPADPIASDPWADDPDGMAAFSSRGPTRDGRIKPDLVAPGTAILSAHSRDANVGSFWGQSSDKLYCFMGGTSMSTPLVAGCAAVVREFFQRQERNPSAALVKAMLINGCSDLPGQYLPSETAQPPNYSEGFGRVNLATSTNASEGNRIQVYDEDQELDTGEEAHFRAEVGDGESLLKVSLVWTDLPGEFLQNDLDLIVVAPDGTELHGNMAPNSTRFDRTNNVEQVWRANAPEGCYRITVRAFNIRVPQSFAVVIRVG